MWIQEAWRQARMGESIEHKEAKLSFVKWADSNSALIEMVQKTGKINVLLSDGWVIVSKK